MISFIVCREKGQELIRKKLIWSSIKAAIIDNKKMSRRNATKELFY